MIYLVNQVTHVGGGQKSCDYLFNLLRESYKIKLYKDSIPWRLFYKKKSVIILSIYYPTFLYFIFYILIKLNGSTVILLNHNLWSAELADAKKDKNYLNIFKLDIYLFLFVYFSSKVIVFSRYHQKMLEKKLKIKDKYFLFPFKETEKILFDRKVKRRKLGIPQKSKVLLFVGRLQPRKGLDLVIDALSILSKNDHDIILLIIFPSGVFSEIGNITSIFKKIETLHLHHKIKLVSGVSGKDLFEYYASSDIFIMSSLFLETFGWTFFEALQTNTKVVSFTNGYPGLICKHCLPKSLVKEKSAESLAFTVKKMLQNGHKKISEQDKKRVYDFVSRDRGSFLKYLKGIV